MGRLQVMGFSVGVVGTNCYFALNKETMEVIIVDPGDEAINIIHLCDERGYHPVAILLTHGHFDHVMAVQEVSSHYGLDAYIYKDEIDVLHDPSMNASWMIGREETYDANCPVWDDEELFLAGFRIRVLFTPGHTPGGCCYYFPDEDALFSGDTLFQRSVGRTDFPKGSLADLVRSIKEKLLVLPDRTVVYPGHMEPTTIGDERFLNPYIQS